MTSRYRVLGLAHPRSGWFREVARWSSSASLPIEVVIAVSGEEVDVHLQSGRPFSVLLGDANHVDLDAERIASAARTGCRTVVVDDGGARRDWTALGAVATLPPLFDRATLGAALAAHALAVDDLTRVHPEPDVIAAPHGARVLAVCGAGGSGTSRVAQALAQGLGRAGRDVVLADLARHADQALVHDVGDVVPGVQELVEAHRHGTLDPSAVRSLTWGADHVPYRVLLGLRHPRDWVGLRRLPTEAALRSLRRAFEVVVADVDDDVEGEADTGSLDIEDRNGLARTTVGSAHLVLVTARPDAPGLRRLVASIDGLRTCGVPSDRVVPVLVGATPAPGRRSTLVRAIAELTARRATAWPARRDAEPLDGSTQPPLFVGWRPEVARAVRDGAALPTPMSTSLARAVTAVADLVEDPDVARTGPPPEPIAPGTLGHWWPDAE